MSKVFTCRWSAGLLAILIAASVMTTPLSRAQQPAGAMGASGVPAPPNPSAEDRQKMMDLLHITTLRRGADGNNKQSPYYANYDESKANPYPTLPESLVMKNGRKVTTAAMWPARRAEITEEFDREIYGRVPAVTPKVTWEVVKTAHETNGGVPVITKTLLGHVDNSGYPAISVNIQLSLSTPANATGPVPVMMYLGGNAPGFPAPAFGFGAAGGSGRGGLAFGGSGRGGIGGSGRGGFAFGGSGRGPAGPTWQQQVLAKGWGYATIGTSSIQADNGAGLTQGIIGLVNKGQSRKADDWGALRAWAWGAERGLDYLQTDPSVDAKHVGIEGVSRYGKAALVTMAYDQRFAVVLVGSSGEGGAKLHRRNFGEAVESLTGTGEYHWMAGNFMKYGASDASLGVKTANDIPVDSHELIALCAPRPTFISYGVPEKGDANWLDHQGSYMATVAAGAVYRLLGAHDIGDKNDYHVAKMPAVNVAMTDGELAWRQHDGGHEDQSNMKYFIAWADKMFHRTPPSTVAAK